MAATDSSGVDLLPGGANEAAARAVARLTVGFLQGVGLHVLYRTATFGLWPATEGLVFAPLVLVTVFVPAVVLLGLGDMRPRSLVFWALAVAAALAGLAMHDIHRGGYGELWPFASGREDSRIAPSGRLWMATVVGLFIAHALATAADADRRLFPAYGRLFDASWKLAVQLVLAAAFVGAFWLLLHLGAALFTLIEVEFFSELIRRPWFAAPATTLAFAAAVHLTDVRAGMVRGMRALKLTLLSWLLPMLALIVASFLAALLFAGLDPLWRTRFASPLLLLAAAALVLLVNAAYQEGDPANPPPRLLRWTGRLAALALAPLTAIAAYGVSLRVAQYGWTPDRILATACIAVVGCYAVGYALAALRPRPWLKGIEATNVGRGVRDPRDAVGALHPRRGPRAARGRRPDAAAALGRDVARALRLRLSPLPGRALRPRRPRRTRGG